MSNTQSKSESNEAVCWPGASAIVTLAHWLEQRPVKAWVAGSSPVYDTCKTQGSSFKPKGWKAQYEQGCMEKVRKVVALSKGETLVHELDSSFSAGLVRLPVVGGLHLEYRHV